MFFNLWKDRYKISQCRVKLQHIFSLMERLRQNQLLLLQTDSLVKFEQIKPKGNNFGFKIIKDVDKIIFKDAERILNTDEYRQLMISLLTECKKYICTLK